MKAIESKSMKTTSIESKSMKTVSMMGWDAGHRVTD
jgi:hypothetical protein